ncbi:MAG: hypothetical protein ACE5IL_11235 [Myxococcota bacterium]
MKGAEAGSAPPPPPADGLITASPRGGNRHALFRIRRDGRSLIVKVYGPKRGALRDAVRGLGHRWISRKTGVRPATRQRTERDLLELWSSCGLRVPRVIDLRLPELESDPRPYLVLEDVGGRSVRDTLARPGADPSRIEVGLEVFASGCARRHGLAAARHEPRLIHTHPGFTHVLEGPEPRAEWVMIDFEHAFRPGAVLDRLIDWELGRWLRELARPGGVRAERLRAAFAAGYSDRDRLRALGAGSRVAPWLPRPRSGRRLPGSARRS